MRHATIKDVTRECEKARNSQSIEYVFVRKHALLSV